MRIRTFLILILIGKNFIAYADDSNIVNSIRFASSSSHLQLTDSFRTYIQVRSDQPGSIPVTLGCVTWGYNAHAVYTNSAWALLPESGITKQPDFTNTYPVVNWTNVYNNQGL